MKIYEAMDPYSRLVRMLCDEKEIDMESVVLSVGAGDAIGKPHLARSPLGQVPVLELDSGAHISGSMAICEYLEERVPHPALIGGTPEARAEARMWIQHVQSNICEPLYTGWRQSLVKMPLHRNRGPVTMPHGTGEILYQIARAHLYWLEGELTDRQFLCGPRFSLADALLYCFLDFSKQVGQLPDPSWTNLDAWFQRVAQRPSANASASVQPDPQQISGSV